MKIRLNNPVDIEIDAFPDTVFKGIVKEIANAATIKYPGTQQEVINFEVKIAILDSIPQLRPGMSASVEIITKTKENVLSVPIQCITLRDLSEDNSESESEEETDIENPNFSSERLKEKIDDFREVVFILNEEKAYIREVKTGISSTNDIEIIEGLRKGETIVSGSYSVLTNDLEDGDLIRIIQNGEN